ncbi:MAG: hypothetical protein EOM23_04340 [Candidatus Moranbacteria bacterium]|nr:hypothetical protein [Candidatus Moranbacteria bacterium]
MSNLRKRDVFIFVFIALIYSSGFSQTKFEREFRISRDDVPLNALSFVDSLSFNSKVKWFKEEGLTSNSIEAKTRFKRERWSIEFSEKGEFQDVEIEIKSTQIPTNVFSKISETMSERHQSYRINKIQVRYTGDRNAVLNFFRENRTNRRGITLEYEIVISSRLDGNFVLMEYTFSEGGSFLLAQQIIENRPYNIDSGI